MTTDHHRLRLALVAFSALAVAALLVAAGYRMGTPHPEPQPSTTTTSVEPTVALIPPLVVERTADGGSTAYLLGEG